MSWLRPYQEECRAAVIDSLSNGSTSTLYVQPTGTGKTEVAMSIIETWPDQHCGVLCLSHREELVYQPWERWRKRHGEYAQMEMGEYRRSHYGHRVTFASKDSLHPRRLQSAFPDPKAVGLIWCDEAHHLAKMNESYQHIVRYFMDGNPNCRLFGCTATPDRTDEAALGQTFDSVAFEFPLFDPSGVPSAVGDGWLVPIEQEFVIVEELSFEKVGSRGGDFIDSQLQRMILEDKGLYKIIAATRDLAGTKPTLCFAAGIEAAIASASILNAENDGSAYAICSRTDNDSPDFAVNSRDKDARRRCLKRWGRGEFQYMCNVGVFTEGTDEPSIACVSMGRPTKSRSLYAQMAGRGMRILKDVIEGDGWRLETPDKRKAAIANSAKPNVLLLDFVGNSRHSLISSVDILGGRYDDDVIEKAKDKISSSEGRQSVTEALEEARQEINAEHEKRRQVRATAESVTRKKVNPFEVIGIIPTREPGWHKGRKPTSGQRRALEKFKVEAKVIEGMSFWEASKTLDRLIGRVKEGKASYAQAKVLSRHGFSTDVSFEQASATIDRISKSGWKLMGNDANREPAGVMA